MEHACVENVAAAEDAFTRDGGAWFIKVRRIMHTVVFQLCSYSKQLRWPKLLMRGINLNLTILPLDFCGMPRL